MSEAEQSRTAAHARVNQASWSITSATAEAHHIARMTRSVDASPDDPSRVVVPNTPSHRADAGQAWGTLVHGLLEHAMRHENVTRDDLRRLGTWLTVEEPRVREVLDLAVDTVIQLSAAEFWVEAKTKKHWVESPFAFAEARTAVTNGVIDLILERGGEHQIIDYKTDVDAQTRATAYAAQLDVYARALSKVNLAVAASAIVPVRSN